MLQSLATFISVLIAIMCMLCLILSLSIHSKIEECDVKSLIKLNRYTLFLNFVILKACIVEIIICNIIKQTMIIPFQAIIAVLCLSNIIFYFLELKKQV